MSAIHKHFMNGPWAHTSHGISSFGTCQLVFLEAQPLFDASDSIEVTFWTAETHMSLWLKSPVW